MNRIKDYLPNSNVVFTGAREIYSENFKKELEKNNMAEWIDIIHFCCTPSLKNYDKVADIIIVDESHLSPLLYGVFIEEQILLNPNVEVLCLTGTPLTNRSEEGRFILKMCPISYSKLTDDNIDNKVLNDYRIKIILHDLGESNDYQTKRYITSEAKQYRGLYNKYQSSLHRPKTAKFSFEMTLLKQFFGKLKSKEKAAKKLIDEIQSRSNKKILVYCGSIDQTKHFDIPTYHSKLSKEEKKENYDAFYDGKIKILTNVNSIKESVSIPDLKYSIAMKVDASSRGMEQILGRILRLSVEDTAVLYVLVARNTIEENWIRKATANLDKSKISYES